MLLDIVILPPAGLRRKIGKRIKKATRGVRCTFIVDNSNLIPHQSLFHLKTSKARLPKLLAVVDGIAKKYPKIKYQSKGAVLSPRGSGIAYYLLLKPEILVKLHKEVLNKCHKFRTGVVLWNLKKEIWGYNKTYRQKYGSQHILKNFHPHVTMVRLKRAEDAPKVLRKMKMNFKFTAREIYVCEVNNWLQVKRVIKKFKLKQVSLG